MVLEVFGFSSSEEDTFFVVEPDPAPAFEVFFEADNLARDVFLTVAVDPLFEVVDARLGVFLAIVGPVYQKCVLITNHNS